MNEIRGVDVVQARSILSRGGVLLDVREVVEWESGRAPGAIHVPLAELPDRLGDLAKDRETVCVCRSGARSRRAAHFLAEQGFDVVNLEGGMLAWSSQGEPLVSDHGDPIIQ